MTEAFERLLHESGELGKLNMRGGEDRSAKEDGDFREGPGAKWYREFGHLHGTSPEEVLQLLKEYGDSAFSDVACTSTRYGKEIGGYLYSPYFYRRWIVRQFGSLLHSWGNGIAGMDLFHFIASNSVISQVEGISLVDPPGDPCDAARIISESVLAQFLVAGRRRRAHVYLVCVRHRSILLTAEVLKCLCRFDHVSVESVERVCMGFLTGEIKSEDFVSFFNCGDEPCDFLRRPMLRKFAELMLSALNVSSFDLGSCVTHSGNEWLVCHDGCVCVITERSGFAEISRKIATEVGVLAILERKNNYIFKERCQFTPLVLLKRIYGREWRTYMEALEELSSGMAELDADAFAAYREEYDYLYAKAGYFYYQRNKLAFEDAASRSEIDKCAAEILAMTPETLKKELSKLAIVLEKEGPASCNRGQFGGNDSDFRNSLASALGAF